MTPMEVVPVGVFDSGVGGLSVLRAIQTRLPAQPLLYFADQAHVPYGARPPQEIRSFATEITRFLLAQGAGIIVVACNTASAAALYELRQAFPEIPFVGMEPAVKPAAETTHSGVVGVLATPATFQSQVYSSVVERFARHVKVLQDPCPGLVEQIEAGDLTTARTRDILEQALRPMLKAGVDTIVMGCTHYPFVIPLIQEIAGPAVRVIDPAPAVARQAGHVLASRAGLPGSRPIESLKFFTSGNAATFAASLQALLNIRALVQPVSWQGESIRDSFF